MQRFAHWTNLSETTFVLPPSSVEADYRVRIFTPVEELPFAGHPTLGTCHAWLEHAGTRLERVVQECAAGFVTVRRTDAGFVDLDVGVAGAYPAGSPAAYEVRAFFPKDGTTVEDPVTGSLNASLAQWLLRTGRATAPYVASQGTALGRDGRVHVTRDDDGAVWVGGGTVTCVAGDVEF